MKAILHVVIAVFLAGMVTSAASSNFSFLNNSPMSKLSADDWKIISGMSDQVLNTYPNNTKAAWKNTDSGHSGYIEALNRTHEKGLECRDVKFVSHTSYGESSDKFKFCKYPNVGWKIPG
jgi:hypothetical protein